MHVLFTATLFVLSSSLHAQTSMLDNTFGTSGTMTAYIAGGDNNYDEGYSVAIQSDGKIVVAGWSIDSQARYAFAVARFDPNGALDNTFGTNGTARTPINGGNMGNDKAYSVAVQSNGKIVLAGYSADTSGGLEHVAFALARFDSNGTLDNTFGTNGTVRALGDKVDIGGIPIYSVGRAVALQPDGKIIVAGYTEDVFFGFEAARFNSNGTLDNAFGTNGEAGFSIGGSSATNDEGYSVAIQHNGKIVIAGFSVNGAANTAFAVARLDSNGTIDNAFGSGGSAATFINGGGNDDEGYSVAIQPDGKIVVAGFSSDTTTIALSNIAFGIARFDSNGTTDSSFGTDGTVRAYINGGDSTNDRAYCVALQSDGKIVAGGGTSGSLGQSSFAIARFTSNGGMDSTFGTKGTATTTFGTDINVSDAARGIVIQGDGKIVAGGYSQGDFGATAFALARYLTSTATGVHEVKSLAKSFALNQNYPNPFNPSTTIQFTVPSEGRATLKVYNVIGQEVAALFNDEAAAGVVHQVQFNGSNLASGVYFSRLEFGGQTQMKKMLLLK